MYLQTRKRLILLTSIVSLIGIILLLSTSVKAYEGSLVGFRTFVSGQDWTDYTSSNQQSGGGDKISAVQLDLDNSLYQKGGIEYRTHNENVGWTGWASNNAILGDSSNGIQAIRIRLSNQLKYYYDVYYRVHVPNVGWSNWAKNSQVAGSEGLGRNANILQVTILNKGVTPDGPVGNAFTQAAWVWPVVGYRNISSPFGPRNGFHHDGFDIAAPGGTPIVSAKTGTVILAAPDGNFGNCVAVEHDSGEVVYYAHMSRIASSVGQRVGAGQVIGYVGTTGNSTGNHLHMEIYNDADDNINPTTYY